MRPIINLYSRAITIFLLRKSKTVRLKSNSWGHQRSFKVVKFHDYSLKITLIQFKIKNAGKIFGPLASIFWRFSYLLLSRSYLICKTNHKIKYYFKENFEILEMLGTNFVKIKIMVLSKPEENVIRFKIFLRFKNIIWNCFSCGFRSRFNSDKCQKIMT